MTVECFVCCELYNKTTRKQVKCLTCNVCSCRSCAKRYVLGNIDPAACMACKSTWSHEFLVDNMTMSFVNSEYAKHREDVLFDQEMTLMPGTMIFAKIHNRIKIVEKERLALKAELLQLRRKHRMVGIGVNARSLHRDTIEEEEEASYERLDVAIAADTIQHKISRADAIRKRLKQRYDQAKTELTDGGGTGAVVRGCPASECRGFLNDDWACVMCKMETCRRCHMVLGDGHVCDENDVKTAVLIVNDTKSCPKCGIPIHKIDGCDQIWCTQCHAAFSWRSGQIELGRIHNPHYFEYMRGKGGGNMAREMRDVPCGGLPTVTEVSRFLNGYGAMDAEDIMVKKRVLAVVSVAETVLQEMLPRYIYEANHDVNSNLDLRVSYMCNEIDKKEFKKVLRRREKTRLKHMDLAQVLNAFVLVVADVLMVMCSESIDTLHEASMQLDEVVTYTDTALAKIGDTYSASPINISRMTDRIR